MPRPYIFQQLADKGRAAGVDMKDRAAAQAWFQDQARKVRSVNVNRLMGESKARMFARGGPDDVGSLLLFFYDPKHKDTLPYWDQFPCAMPIEFYGDSFLSINFHYLPPLLRAKLLNAMYQLAVMEKDKVKKLKVSYQILKSASRFKEFVPCIKQHLFSHVRSRFMYVYPEEWDMAVLLPTQRFMGASQDKIWRDSRNKIRRA